MKVRGHDAMSIGMSLGLIVAVAVAMWMLLAVPKHVTLHNDVPRPPNTYRFNPQPDMTNQELALAINAMVGGPDHVMRMKSVYDMMPPSSKRHWLPPETGPLKPTEPITPTPHSHP